MGRYSQQYAPILYTGPQKNHSDPILRKDNGFHAGAFQRSSLKLMLNYARIFVLCASLTRIQKLQSAASASDSETMDQRVLNLWQSLVTTIMDLIAFIITEPAYRCQLQWAPTYPALSIAFVSKLSSPAMIPEHRC